MAWYSFYSDVYAINEDLDLSVFADRGTDKYNSVYLIVFGVVVGISDFSFPYRYRNKRRKKRAISGAFGSNREMLDFGFNISKATSATLTELGKAANMAPEKLLTSNVLFEKTVDRLHKISPFDPLLLKITSLREDLGYTFSNKRNQFVCTQMLSVGQKLRVTVKYKKKNHAYVGTILNTNEHEFWVTPPIVKGKAVDLSKFRFFDFSIFRKNDGEYRFRARSKIQISKPQHALVMLHANKINKLHIRKVARFKVEFELIFHFYPANMHVKVQVVGVQIYNEQAKLSISVPMD